MFEQRASVRDWRQIGLGIFGLADMLIKMGIEYGSGDSLSLCDNIGIVMADAAIRTSAYLARLKGSYNKFRESYEIILKYIEDNDYEIIDNPRECYIDGCWNKENEEDYFLFFLSVKLLIVVSLSEYTLRSLI